MIKCHETYQKPHKQYSESANGNISEWRFVAKLGEDTTTSYQKFPESS